MTTIYLIIAIVALTGLLIGSLKISGDKRKALKKTIDLKQHEVDTLQDEIQGQQEEIRKRDEMIDTLQEIEIDHIKKSKKLRTPDNLVNVRNATDIMRDLQTGNGDSDKDSSTA